MTRRLLAQALQLHRAGRRAEAEALYRRVLRAEPDHADALHLLGVAAHQDGRHGQAVDLIGRAQGLAPGEAAIPNNLGTALQSLGRLEDAEACFRRALALEPDHADALVNLGAVLRAQGRPGESIPCFRRALDLDPDSAEAHADLGLALQASGRLDEAATYLERALDLQPDLVSAHLSLGAIRQAQGRPAEAGAGFRRALDLRPDVAEAYDLLGAALRDLNRPEEAAPCFERAIALKPTLAEAHNNLGALLADGGRHEEAVARYRQALALKPDFAEACANLGAALQELDRAEEAEVHFRRALELKPDFADPYTHLGVRLHRRGALAHAAVCHRRALELKPDFAEAYANLGLVLQDGGAVEEAAFCFERAVALQPDRALARLNLGLLRLGGGDLGRGWAGYEWRFAAARKQAHHRGGRLFPVPEWRGEDLRAKRVLVWREQGVGDELMFAGLYPDLIARAGRVVIECDPRLVSLFRRSFPDADVRPETADTSGSATDYDRHVPAASVAHWLRPDPTRFPARSGYLVPDPERAARWRERLAGLGDGPKVGIGWRSGLTTGTRAAAYARLDRWGPILGAPGVRFVNLQYGDCESEITLAEQRFGVPVARWPDLDLKDDLDGAAALTAGLDLVISAATSVGEMAGALGVPVWRFAPGGDWTVLGTTVRPWFPSMRLFYARTGETLDDVLGRIGAHLKQAVSGVALG